MATRKASKTSPRSKPARARKTETPGDPREEQRRLHFGRAREGGRAEQKRFAAHFKAVSIDEVKVRVGGEELTLEELLPELKTGLEPGLVEPFAAPLLWDANRARSLMIDCAERVTSIFDQSFFGHGQCARVIKAARGLLTGTSDRTEREEARAAAHAVEPWDDQKLAQWACSSCLAADDELEPATVLNDIREIRTIRPDSLDDSMSADEAEAAERAWQIERLWGYLTGAIPVELPSPERRRLLAAQLELRRVEGMRKALLSRKKLVERSLAAAQKQGDKAAVRVWKQALALLR